MSVDKDGWKTKLLTLREEEERGNKKKIIRKVIAVSIALLFCSSDRGFINEVFLQKKSYL